MDAVAAGDRILQIQLRRGLCMAIRGIRGSSWDVVSGLLASGRREIPCAATYQDEVERLGGHDVAVHAGRCRAGERDSNGHEAAEEDEQQGSVGRRGRRRQRQRRRRSPERSRRHRRRHHGDHVVI